MAAHQTSNGTVYETRLANGLLVVLKPVHTAPVISLNVAYRVGSKFEQPGITGISHLLEHMMFKTTGKFALGEFDRRLKVVGADNNAYTWLDQTVYYESIAADQVEVALELEADRMRNLALTVEDHAFEMTVVRNELDQRDDSPFTLLYEELLATAFVAHPYRVPTIGYPDDVEGITVGDLRAHYERFYHPDNAFLIAVGDFKPEQLLARIEAHFGVIPAGGVKLPRLTREPEQHGERRFEIERSGQVDYLLMAWHIPQATDPDSFPLVVLGNVLAGGRTSRLYKALVDTGLCAEASAWASNFGHTDPFLFFCSAMLSEGIAPEHAEPVFYGILHELATSGPTERELARAKKSVRASFAFDQDSLDRQAGALVEFELMSSWRDLDTYLPGIEAVTAEDVQRVAAQYLTKRNRTVGIYRAIKPEGDKGKEPSHAAIEPHTEAELAGEPSIGVVPPQRSGSNGMSSRPGQGRADQVVAQPSGAAGPPTAPTLVTNFDNGLTVVVRENRANPTVSLHGLLRAGRIDDPPELPGLAAFAIEMQASGSEQHDKFQLAELLEDNGIDVSFAPGRETCSFAGRALSEDFGVLLDALAEMLLRSNFPEPEVEKTRKEILSDLLDAMNSTRSEASTAARELLYGADHPFAGRISGTPDSVRRMTRRDLADWDAAHIAPEGAIITVVGDVKLDAAVEAVQARFGSFTGGPRDEQRKAVIARGEEWQPVSGQRQHVPLKQKKNVSLTWIAPGLSKLHPLWPAYFIANFIFGGDFYSRLNERLRVKDGLTYGSHSRFMGGRAAGPLLVTAQVSPANVERAAAATEQELARFSEAGATEAELALAHSYLTGNFPVQLSTNGAVAAMLTDSLYLGRGVEYIERYREVITGVTLEQVNAAAAEMYAPGRFGLVTAGSMD